MANLTRYNPFNEVVSLREAQETLPPIIGYHL
jgi:hypothetical protein